MDFSLEFSWHLLNQWFSFYVSNQAAPIYWVAILMTLIGAFCIANIVYIHLFKESFRFKKPLVYLAVLLVSGGLIFSTMTRIYHSVGIDLYASQRQGDEMSPDIRGYWGR